MWPDLLLGKGVIYGWLLYEFPFFKISKINKHACNVCKLDNKIEVQVLLNYPHQGFLNMQLLQILHLNWSMYCMIFSR